MVASLDHQPSSHGSHARWIWIGVAVVVIATVIVLIALFSGGGSSTGY